LARQTCRDRARAIAQAGDHLSDGATRDWSRDSGGEGSRRGRQIALEHDALVLFVDAFDPVARVARVAIGCWHQLANFVLTARRCAKDPWDKIDNLSDGEFMRH